MTPCCPLHADPSALHLLSCKGPLSYLRQPGSTQRPGSTCISSLLLRAMQVLRRLKHASEAGKLPCDDADLTFIVRMLQVGLCLPCLLSAHDPHSTTLSSLPISWPCTLLAIRLIGPMPLLAAMKRHCQSHAPACKLANVESLMRWLHGPIS